MNPAMLKLLVERARDDPELFHALVFDPEKAIAKFQNLDDDTIAALRAAKPEEFVARLAGETVESPARAGIDAPEACTGVSCYVTCSSTCSSSQATTPDLRRAVLAPDALLSRNILAAGCGGDVTCSCTSSTCGGVTCGGSTCSVTCSGDSCGQTCGDSCGTTTNLEQFDMGDFVRDTRNRWR
jgi:hypothetical protein